MRTCPGRTCRPRPAPGTGQRGALTGLPCAGTGPGYDPGSRPRPRGGVTRPLAIGGFQGGRPPGPAQLSEAGGASTVAGIGPLDDGRRPRFGAQLCVDPVYVVFDRFLGKNELGSDFTVGVPVRDERNDFGLAYGKA